MAFVGAKTGTISTQECIYWLFSKRRFSEMGIALLLLSWGVELGGGGWCVYTFWMVEQWQGVGHVTIYGPGYVIVWLYNTMVLNWYHAEHLHRHPSLLTQEQVAWFFLLVFVALHLLAAIHGLSQPARERTKLGVRMHPSAREIDRFEQAFTQLLRGRPTHQDAPSLKKPRFWKVRDGRGMQIRWIGWVLVIDEGLLASKHFPALLAHALARTSSLDRFTRTLFDLFPPFRWAALTLVGLPNACGKILFYPVWMQYWRDRVYAADEYAARLGQRYQLIHALDDLKWTMDGGTATRGGRWLRETPYIESRIDRLMQYQAPRVRVS